MDCHAIEALEAFIVANFTVLRDRVVIAPDFAQLTGRTTFGPARDPVRQAQKSANGHEGAERAEVAAKALEQYHAEKQQTMIVNDQAFKSIHEASSAAFE